MGQKTIKGLFLVALLFLGAVFPAQAALNIEVQEGLETIILDVRPAHPNKIFFLDNPNRLVVDVPYAGKYSVSLPRDYRGQLIDKVRVGRFNKETLRIVFDLKRSAMLIAKDVGDRTLRITIAAGTPSKAPPPAPPPPPPPLVIIDPGHGGRDPGALGPRGTKEKDVTLRYAKELRLALEKTGRYRTELTRDTDEFITLRERVAIARREKGDLFISIHADSAPKKDTRGLSVYTLSETASDAEAASLAARENKVDILADVDLSNERADIADILISLAQRDTKNQSALFADQLVLSLDGRAKLLSKPHRFAGFVVLKAPDIPSVLIEVGFLSHPSEEKLLGSADYRKKIISGIVAGIDKYFAVKDIAEP